MDNDKVDLTLVNGAGEVLGNMARTVGFMKAQYPSGAVDESDKEYRARIRRYDKAWEEMMYSYLSVVSLFTQSENVRVYKPSDESLTLAGIVFGGMFFAVVWTPHNEFPQLGKWSVHS